LIGYGLEASSKSGETKENIFIGVNMSTKMSLLAVTALLAAGSVFADGHGVEKMLPVDATNVRLQSATLDQVATGLVQASDGNIDGPTYDNTYTTELSVVVAYDSKDLSDDENTLGSGQDGQIEPWDPAPQDAVTYQFQLSAAQIAAIKAGTLDPKSLITVSSGQDTFTIDAPSAPYVCSYDESNHPLYGCVEPAAKQITVTRPALFVDQNY
jgi:hypothetical protein